MLSPRQCTQCPAPVQQHRQFLIYIMFVLVFTLLLILHLVKMLNLEQGLKFSWIYGPHWKNHQLAGHNNNKCISDVEEMVNCNKLGSKRLLILLNLLQEATGCFKLLSYFQKNVYYNSDSSNNKQ